MHDKRKRYAQVGLGGRAVMFQDAVLETFAASCRMVGYCDTNPGRLQRAVEGAAGRGTTLQGYAAADFDRMLAETRPDTVIVTYRNGVTLSYSLNAFMPWEGHIVSFNGTKGRLEHRCEETVYINGDGTVPGALKKEGTWTRIYPHWQPAYGIDIWEAEGGHGGADPVMLRYIFDPEHQPEDTYRRASDQRAGAFSILVGVAANHAMARNRPIRIDDLVAGLAEPDYPAMPSPTEPLPIPAHPDPAHSA
jgi:hypothetical protein